MIFFCYYLFTQGLKDNCCIAGCRWWCCEKASLVISSLSPSELCHRLYADFGPDCRYVALFEVPHKQKQHHKTLLKRPGLTIVTFTKVVPVALKFASHCIRFHLGTWWTAISIIILLSQEKQFALKPQSLASTNFHNWWKKNPKTRPHSWIYID